MTKQQIKSEIQKALDQVPESVLQDILDFLIDIQTKTTDQVEMSRHLKKILKEDKELLEKLAQWSTLTRLNESTKSSSTSSGS